MITGYAVRVARGRRGLTQQELADTLGASRRSVVEWEKHPDQPLPAYQQGRVADALGIDIGTGATNAPTDTLTAATDMQLIAELTRRLAELRAATQQQEEQYDHRPAGTRPTKAQARAARRRQVVAWLADPGSDPELQGRLSQLPSGRGTRGHRMSDLRDAVLDTRRQELEAELVELGGASSEGQRTG